MILIKAAGTLHLDSGSSTGFPEFLCSCGQTDHRAITPFWALRSQGTCMKSSHSRSRLRSSWAWCCLALLMVACGGGGSSAPVAVPLTDLERAAEQLGIDPADIGGDGDGDAGAGGGAGDGAPLRRAAVSLTDARGNQVRGTTNDKGKFLLRYKTSAFVAPLVLRVSQADGSVLSSVTEDSGGRGSFVRANINPLTDKITSDAISASIAGTDKAFDGSHVNLTRLSQAKTDLLASVRVALTAAGVSNVAAFDAIKSVYEYDGTGADLVIDSIAHSRDPATGATQLRAKLSGLQTGPDGSVSAKLITATTPLLAEQLALPSSPTLGFNKISAWIDEINRCLSLAPAQRSLDVDCVDADGSRLFSKSYRNDSADLVEDLPFMDMARAGQGNVLRNPLILFTTKFADSSAPFDDMAVVEVTLQSPGSPVPTESVRTLVFKRNDALTRAKAGNWILLGNQNRFSTSVVSIYFKHRQINPAPQPGAVQTKVESCIDILMRSQVFDPVSRTWQSAGIRAARVFGPGLPSPGLVFAAVPGEYGLGIINKTGTVPLAASTSAGPVTFFLASSTPTGDPLPDSYVSGSVDHSSPMVTDFSPLQAYARYRIEVFLDRNSSGVPDFVEYAYNLASVSTPKVIPTMLDNDLAPSVPLVTAPSPGAETLTVRWTNNASARPVTYAQIYSTQRDARATVFGFGQSSVPGLLATGLRPSSQVVRASFSTIDGATQSTATFPALTDPIRDSRRINIRTGLARNAEIVSWIDWN